MWSFARSWCDRKKGQKKAQVMWHINSINHKWMWERVRDVRHDLGWMTKVERIFLERWSPNQFDWINYKCKESVRVFNKLINLCESERERERERVREWEWKSEKEWEVWDWKFEPPQFSMSQNNYRTLLRHQMLAGEKKRNRKWMRFNYLFNKSEVMRWKVNQCVTTQLK